jgi:multidrug resistance efflux pump
MLPGESGRTEAYDSGNATDDKTLKKYSGIILLVVILLASRLPLSVPFRLESAAYVEPLRQWVLTRHPDGSVTTAFRGAAEGLASGQVSYQFDRGDQVLFHLSAGPVGVGDTLLVIRSNRLEEQLVELRTSLAVERAALAVVETGEKPELRAQLAQSVRLARENLSLQEKLVERARRSYAEGLVSLQEQEIAENAYRAALLRLQVVEEEQSVVETGEKPETRSLSRARMAALSNQVSFLEDKARGYVVTAPFGGRLRELPVPEGQQWVLEDTSASQLTVPVRSRDVPHLRAGDTVRLSLAVPFRTFACRVKGVGQQLRVLDMEQVVLVTLHTQAEDLVQGGPIRCHLDLGPVRLSDYLQRSLGWW